MSHANALLTPKGGRLKLASVIIDEAGRSAEPPNGSSARPPQPRNGPTAIGTAGPRRWLIDPADPTAAPIGPPHAANGESSTCASPAAGGDHTASPTTSNCPAAPSERCYAGIRCRCYGISTTTRAWSSAGLDHAVTSIQSPAT